LVSSGGGWVLYQSAALNLHKNIDIQRYDNEMVNLDPVFSKIHGLLSSSRKRPINKVWFV